MRTTLRNNTDQSTSNTNTRVNKEDQVRVNYSRGRSFANQQIAALRRSGEYSNITREVTLVSDNGVRMRADAIALDSESHLVIFEFKSSETARLTKHQEAVFDGLTYDGIGATIVGRNGGETFPAGYRIEPNTTIKVIRPSGTKNYIDLY